jgi:hypothetical protein
MNTMTTSARLRSAVLACSLVLLAGLAAACGDDPIGPPAGSVVFDVRVSGETFHVAVTDTAQIRRFDERLASGVEGVINGALRAGHGGFNAPWGWHLDPATVEAVDMAIELCDGRPSMVQADLTYWIGTVGRFCPWGATVVAKRP